MRIQELLEIGVNELKKANIESPISVAKQLMCYVTRKDKIYLITNADTELGNEQKQCFLSAISQVANNVPLQHITNKQEFMGMDFYVDENVLIPRADTEVVVEEALQIIKRKNFTNVLDMCTGSGAIAISIAKYVPNCNVVAVDISTNALEITKKNARTNEVNNITFIQSNMFEKITSKYDLIISNPPYIRTKVIDSLDENVKKEPMLALDGGNDGLDFYRNIEQNAYEHLNEGGYLVLEIGFDQKEEVTKLLEDKYIDIICKKDLGGNNRVIICKRR